MHLISSNDLPLPLPLHRFREQPVCVEFRRRVRAMVLQAGRIFRRPATTFPIFCANHLSSGTRGAELAAFFSTRGLGRPHHLNRDLASASAASRPRAFGIDTSLIGVGATSFPWFIRHVQGGIRYQKALDMLINAERVDNACGHLKRLGPARAVLSIDSLDTDAVAVAGIFAVRGVLLLRLWSTPVNRFLLAAAYAPAHHQVRRGHPTCRPCPPPGQAPGQLRPGSQNSKRSVRKSVMGQSGWQVTDTLSNEHCIPSRTSCIHRSSCRQAAFSHGLFLPTTIFLVAESSSSNEKSSETDVSKLLRSGQHEADRTGLQRHFCR